MNLKVKSRKYVETCTENGDEDYYVFKLREIKGTAEVTVKDFNEIYRLGDVVELKLNTSQSKLNVDE